MGIQKLFYDLKLADSPLYVVTFLGNTCPESIRVGYAKYKIDTFYPSPMRYNKCCRYCHTTKYCHSSLICSHCGGKGYIRDQCTTIAPKCINCQGIHDATSKECPKYKLEHSICKIKIDKCLTYPQARTIATEKFKEPLKKLITPTQLKAQYIKEKANAFPTLTQLMNQPTPEHNRYGTLQESELSESDEPNLTYAEATSGARTYSLSAIDTQRSITPGQGHRKQHRKHKRQKLSETQEEMEANSRTEACSVRKIKQKNKNSEDYISNIKNLLIGTLPVIIRLFMTNAITDKIECFTEIGKILNAGNTVEKELSNLNLTSMLISK